MRHDSCWMSLSARPVSSSSSIHTREVGLRTLDAYHEAPLGSAVWAFCESSPVSMGQLDCGIAGFASAITSGVDEPTCDGSGFVLIEE